MSGEGNMSLDVRSIVKRTTYPLGYEFESNGVVLRVVERGEVDYPCNACDGCFFHENYLTCPRSQCSSMGRTDGLNVWFVEVSKSDVYEEGTDSE